jgi:hypothetical protein
VIVVSAALVVVAPLPLPIMSLLTVLEIQFCCDPIALGKSVIIFDTSCHELP